MLRDTLAVATGLEGVTPALFFHDEPGATEFFSGLAPDMESFPQEGEDLGKRMENAFLNRFERGFREVVIIGTDSPDQPPEHILEAFDLLADKKIDLVLGPAEDGGYYLMGLKSVREELFCGIQWSSGEVFATTVSKAKELGLGVSLLPVWHDIDTAADLERSELLDPKGPSVRTREFIISGLRPGNRRSADG
jgi:rSAM/selenodomain-associated transferase 1